MNENIKFAVSHPTGNTFVRALLQELQKNGNLSNYFTTIGFGNGFKMCSNYLIRRSYPIPDDKITRQWLNECIRLLFPSKEKTKQKLTDKSYICLDKKVSKIIANREIKILHAYEDVAYHSFSRAKQNGIHCSYELPIAYWKTVRRLLSEEAERYPQWEPTLGSTREPEEKLIRKESEIKLADCITCPSKFVLDSIPIEIRQNKKCIIAPFGSPNCEQINFQISKNSIKTFKLLFVGSMSQRKGLADLFMAMKLLSKEPVSLSILGQPSMPMEFYKQKYSNFKYFPACSNKMVREIMKAHDALVLPSIVEGRALVQQEALSCGIPIIITPNTGGEDLVINGITGHIVPIRSPEKIAEKIIALIESKTPKVEVAENCQKKAKAYLWGAYAKKIINCNLYED
ncbi:glycosyltransferase [Opitutales bacterium]|nr:glycosyltransferase [Opitutales bacterium]